MCALFMDTEKERQLKIGTKYKFDKLKEGECIIHEEMADQLRVEVGDIVFMQMSIRNNL